MGTSKRLDSLQVGSFHFVFFDQKIALGVEVGSEKRDLEILALDVLV